MVADATGGRLVPPFTFALDHPGLADLAARVERSSLLAKGQVDVGNNSAGHYHRPGERVWVV